MSQLGESSVVYVNPNDDLKTVLSCFKTNQISHVPVVNEKKVVGIISKTDVVEYIYDHMDDLQTMEFSNVVSEVQAKQLMVQPLVAAKKSDSEKTLIEKLTDHQVSSVVITGDNGDLLAIVTDKDMLKYLASRESEPLTFTEELSLNVVQWLDEHGIIRASKALADIGI